MTELERLINQLIDDVKSLRDISEAPRSPKWKVDELRKVLKELDNTLYEISTRLPEDSIR
jgi:hypothetical protein